jgi:drug/metabolite transporter (DMT)-like permease
MIQQKTLTPRALVDLLLLGLIWGGVFLATRLVIDEVSVMSAVTLRVGLAAVILWGFVWLRGLDVPRSPKLWGAFLGMGVLNNMIPFSLLTWSQLHIESGLTSILNGTTAILGVVVAALCFADEKLTRIKLLGVSLGFAGVICAIGPDALRSFDIRSMAQIAAILATLSYAIAGVWARKTMAGAVPVVAAAGMLTTSTLFMIPLTLGIEGTIALPQTITGYLALFYFAAIATSGAYLLYYRVLATAGSGNLMFVTLIIPPIAIALGAIFLDEELGPGAYLGFILLAAGLIVMNFQSRRSDAKSTSG